MELYLQRAKNEHILSEALMRLSVDATEKKHLGITEDATFFSNAIAAAYYCIFYSAKAYLLSKGIEVKPPEEHRKTYERFRELVEAGELDYDLLHIYEDAQTKAEELLRIFTDERKNRGTYTYSELAQANKQPAEQSARNAQKFYSRIRALLKK